jgi:hypothetical protein
MAQTSFPFENIDTSETEYSYLMRNLGQGIIEGRLNELEPSANGSGMTVEVATGEALVRGHYYRSNATETVTLSDSNPTNPRIDSVVLRLDPGANSIILAVLTGTPDAAPVATSLTQSDTGIYEILIATINVEVSSVVVASEDVTDGRIIYVPWPGSVDISGVTGLVSALAAKALLTPAVNAKTANYTLAVEESGEFITCDGTFTLTIPSATFSAGARIDFVNIGTGVITIAGSGVTVNSVDAALTIDTQWAGATFFFTSSSAGVLIGRLA